MKKKLQTKQELLEALLDISQKNEKVEASLKRLHKRQENITSTRRKLAGSLLSLCVNESNLTGKVFEAENEPMIYKNHIFTLESSSRCYPYITEVNIKGVTNVK